MPTPSETEILEKIRKEPYYSLRILPMTGIELTLKAASELIRKDAVRLRGWDMPHYDSNEIGRTQAYIFNGTDWASHVELWRMYRSGQFVYFGAPWDLAMDHQDKLRAEFDKFVFMADEPTKADVPGVLSFVGMIYSVTEFFIFAARLAKSLETTRFSIDLTLHNIEKWALVSGEVGTLLWHYFYQARTPEIRISRDFRESSQVDPLAESADALREIFECFSWDNSEGSIKNWQQKFMAGRFTF